MHHHRRVPPFRAASVKRQQPTQNASNKHEQLFVSIDTNACPGRREKGQVGSKNDKILGAYGRDTLNDNGELLLLSFANYHDLALVNPFHTQGRRITYFQRARQKMHPLHPNETR